MERTKEIAKLDAAFGAGEVTMDEYAVRRKSIEADPALQTRSGARWVSWKSFTAILEQFTDSALKHFKADADSIAELKRQNAEHERRISGLESRPTLKYCGVFDPAAQYGEGSLITFHGSMWHAKRSTRTRPPSDDWTQCVQRGKDGKDLR